MQTHITVHGHRCKPSLVHSCAACCLGCVHWLLSPFFNRAPGQLWLDSDRHLLLPSCGLSAQRRGVGAVSCSHPVVHPKLVSWWGIWRRQQITRGVSCTRNVGGCHSHFPSARSIIKPPYPWAAPGVGRFSLSSHQPNRASPECHDDPHQHRDEVGRRVLTHVSLSFSMAASSRPRCNYWHHETRSVMGTSTSSSTATSTCLKCGSLDRCFCCLSWFRSRSCCHITCTSAVWQSQTLRQP
mmetsp:Transcript_22154/g.52645  ORF Transcript_22154/g.52645 Transcript_22154/m.52645 type:complete len:240 (-) Transcript_22154:918-1637(-)